MLQSNTQVAMSKKINVIGGSKASSLSVEGDDKRRFKRVSVLWSGEYSDSEGADQQCVIYDISVNGVRAKFDHVMEIGAQLVIKIAGGIQLMSEVVWARGETVGLCFKDNPDKLASIMAGVLPMACLEYA
ncbi:MAG: PilZ domain-containing protein [Halopseudomonas aestusnigri]